MSKDFKGSVRMGVDDNGKPIYKHFRASSRKELERLKEEAKKERNDLKKQNKDVTKATKFGYWCDEWINSKEKRLVDIGKLSRGTYIQYLSATKHLNERFYNKEFKDFTTSDFQKFLDYLSSKEGGELSASTLKSIITVAKCVFHYASANKVPYVPGDYFFGELVVCAKAPNERRALTTEEIEWIIDTPFRMQVPSMIMLFSGLRRGEVVPLQWSDIDLEKGIISVTKSVQFINNTPIVKDGGKTKSATRDVPIPPILVDYLREYKRSLKIVYPLVCTNRENKMYTESSWKKDWELYLALLNAKYGYNNLDISHTKARVLPMKIERFTPHYLRHTYATLLYLQNVPPRNSMMYLGHSSINVTINIYEDFKTHKVFDLDDSFKSKLDNEYKIRLA